MSTRLRDEAPGVTEPGAEPSGWTLDAEQIARLDRETLGPGVEYALLWVGGGSSAGLMWFDGGAALDEHTHRRHAHHVWVTAGRVDALGRSLGPGSYAYVPPGQRHGSVAGPDGATLFYLYLEVARRDGAPGGTRDAPGTGRRTTA